MKDFREYLSGNKKHEPKDTQHSDDLYPVGAIEGTVDHNDRKYISETRFGVLLVDAGTSKLSVVKLVKDVTCLGLKEAKDMVDNVPSVIKDDVTEAEAKALKTQFEEVGATCRTVSELPVPRQRRP